MKQFFLYASSLLLFVTFHALLRASQLQILEQPRQNDAQFLVQLGENYFQGIGVERDYSKAFKYFTDNAVLDQTANKSAKEYAQARLAEMYYFGKGVALDRNKALHYCRASITENTWAKTHVQLLLAELDRFGYTGQLMDWDRSRRLYTAVIRQNNNDWAKEFAQKVLDEMDLQEADQAKLRKEKEEDADDCAIQ